MTAHHAVTTPNRRLIIRSLSSALLTLGTAILAVEPSARELPDAISACMRKAPARLAVRHSLVPPYLTGDFDGDGRTDHAVLVENGKMQGILFCWGRTVPPRQVGAGIGFNGMKDLDFHAWRVHRKNQPVSSNAAGERVPALSGDAIVIEWESASALVHWQRGAVRWHQQGD